MAIEDAKRRDRTRFSAVSARLEQVADSAWFAYGSIFLIQARLLWGIWDHRDLTNGDTSSYYRSAFQWADGFEVEPLFSPLYTILYGSLHWLVPGPYEVTILHRVIIVFAASLLVLAVFRKLLPAGIAWTLALWWTLLPVNFDTVYEVHLFALLPSLAAVLVALHRTGLEMRATVLAILVASGLLVRNELLVAAFAWAGVWIVYEVWRMRHGLVKRLPTRRAVAALAAPAVLALLVLGLLGPSQFGAETSAGQSGKQALVLCQNYAVGADQRGEVPFEYDNNKQLSCRKLMRELFDEPFPTWTQAARANPSALADHFVWNAGLIPQGVELMLFDQISGSDRRNPDLVPVTTQSPAALVGLMAVIVIAIVGLTLLWRERRRWWDEWLRDRAWGWAVLGCLLVAGIVVMLTIRPRPSYLFAVSVLLLAGIGMCALVIGSRRPQLARLRAGIPLVAVVVLIAIPSYYTETYQTPQAGEDRPLLQMVDRLEPFEDDLGRIGARFLAPQFAGEACQYVAPESPCRGTSLLQAVRRKPKGTSLPQVMKQLEVGLIYADELVITNPSVRDLLVRLERKGWDSLGPPISSDAGWALLRRPATLNEPGT